MLGAGGAFATAGGLYASNAASWDGAAWSPLVTPRGNGMNGGVFALTVYDDGRGPALYAAGYFSRAGQVDANLVAKWDGSSWSPLGSGLSGGTAANTLTVFDDGSGPALYVGGRFTTAGGFTVNNIAKWDGAAWSALSTGVNLDVYALAVVDLGSGPALYAGGAFMTAGGVTVNRVARWDGTSWSALGSGFNHSVYALAGYDNGDGPGLFAGGEFTRSGGLYVNYIARWDGTAWNQLQREFDGSVLALRVMDDGVQTALYAGGTFENSAFFVLHHVGRYVGRTDNYYWRPLGDGVEPGSSNRVRALAEFNAGASPVVAAGGYFDTAGGGPAPNIALWNGTNWSPLGSGVNTNVYALAAWDDGSGPALWAGGVFHTAGGKPSDRIAKWTCVSGAVRAAQGCPSSRTLADHSELSALAPQPRARAADDRAAPVWPGLRADDRRAAPDPHVAQDMAAREDMCAGAIWSTTDDLDDWDWALASQVDVEHSSADDFWFEGEPAGYTFVGAVHWQSHYWNGPYVAPDRGSISIMMDVDGAPSYELRYYYFSDSNLLIVPVNDESVQCQVVLRRAFRADNNVRYWISINVDADYPPAWGPVCHVADPPLGHPVHWVGPDWDSAWTPFYDPAGDTLDLNFCLLPGQPWICEVLGDVNGDGVCNNFDITPFVFALTHGEADFAVRYPGGHYWCADCNQDGAVNNFDITPFVHVLIGQ
jgi:hypothetical protein